MPKTVYLTRSTCQENFSCVTTTTGGLVLHGQVVWWSSRVLWIMFCFVRRQMSVVGLATGISFHPTNIEFRNNMYFQNISMQFYLIFYNFQKMSTWSLKWWKYMIYFVTYLMSYQIKPHFMLITYLSFFAQNTWTWTR